MPWQLWIVFASYLVRSITVPLRTAQRAPKPSEKVAAIAVNLIYAGLVFWGGTHV